MGGALPVVFGCHFTFSIIAENCMVINENKSKCLLICTSQRVAKVKHNLSVHVNDTTLENVESDKLLGLHIDTSLNFNKHVDTVCKFI